MTAVIGELISHSEQAVIQIQQKTTFQSYEKNLASKILCSKCKLLEAMIVNPGIIFRGFLF
ncbi:MAG: hypothetical protein RIR96_59 [Bacteroidota bacterium]|jgi:hypothetical protein